MQPEQIILAPMVTEKAVTARQFARYTFKVHPQATKIDVKMAIEKLFKVSVKDVNTISIRGKFKRRGAVLGKKPDWKKAYVTLTAGAKIEELES